MPWIAVHIHDGMASKPQSNEDCKGLPVDVKIAMEQLRQREFMLETGVLWMNSKSSLKVG